MPYRRLPNTDSARLKALHTTLEIGKEIPPFKLAFSQKTLQAIQSFLPSIEHAISIQKQSFSNQVEKNRDYHSHLKKAKLYISHFIQVMNMAIQRGDLPASTRAYYGIEENEKNLPPLNTEKELIEWGDRIINGELMRVRKGKTAITNPTAAVVRVRYEKFLDTYQYQKTLQKRSLEHQEKLTLLRARADQIIQQSWNEIEEHFKELPDELRREESRKYGIVYVYRKSELPQNELFHRETQLNS